MSNHHDRAIAASWEQPVRRTPDPMAVVVEDFAQRDPIAATRALAHGLACQTDGAQLAAVRMLAEMLVKRTPSLAADLARDLAGLGTKP